MLTNEHDKYFNPKSVLHIWIICFLFIVGDVAILIFTEEYYYSKSFHFKIVLCLVYLAVSKEKSISILQHQSVDAAFHFSAFLFCFWLLIMNIPVIRDDASRMVGLFLAAGALLGLNIADELGKTIRSDVSPGSRVITLSCIAIKIAALSMLIFSVINLFFGSWGMNIEPFYEW